MKYRLCFVVFFAISTFLFSQEKEKQAVIGYKETSLEQVLKNLEANFNIRFSFNDLLVKNKKVTLRQRKRSLIEVLGYLENSLHINFEVVTERYIVLKPKRGNICGRLVTDEKVNLSHASVVSVTEKKGAVSNEDGMFEIKQLVLTDTLQIQYIGYETVKIPVHSLNRRNCPEIRLVKSYEKLSEIILKEYITKGVLQSVEGAVVIQPGQLGILPGLTEPDVLQSVQLLPGIESPDETASGLYVRGGTPDQNLILLDGITIYHTGHFFGLISAFNPYIADEISVYKGGTKARYGNRISGVIDIQTDSEIPDSISGGVGFNMTHADFLVKTPIGKSLGVIVSARRSISDIINTFTFNKLSKKVFQNTNLEIRSEGIEQNTDFFFSDAVIKLLARPSPKDHLSFTSVFVKNKLDNELTIPEFDVRNTINQDIDNSGLNLQWERNWSKNVNHVLKIKQSSYDLEFGTSSRIQNTQFSLDDRTNQVNEFGIDFLVDIQLGKYHKITSGYQFENNEVSYLLNRMDLGLDDLNFDVDGIINTHALFSEYHFMNNTIDLVAGLRGTHLSLRNLYNLEPRFYLGVQTFRNFKLKTSGEIRYQSISQIVDFLNTGVGLSNQIWSLSNDFTPILKSRQVSAGFLFTKDDWYIDLEAYYKDITGITSFTNGFGSNVVNALSEGESITKGIDLLIKKKYRNFRFWFGYQLGKTEFSFPDIQEGRFPGNFDIRQSLQIATTYKWKQFQFSLGWNYRTGIPFTEEPTIIEDNGSFFRVNDVINSRRLPDYHRLDFSMTYDFYLSKKRGVKASTGFSLLNVYDQESVLSRRFDAFLNADGEPVINEVDLNSLRITPNFVLRLSF